MFILGLTGSIGMGKSETARMFRRLGVPVHDADAAVHTLYAKGGGAAVGLVAEVFPDAVIGGAIDRTKLSALVLGNEAELARLEKIVHPLVAGARDDFLAMHDAANTPVVVLEVPLLFEVSGAKGVDAIVVVSAPAEVQRRRVLLRPGMSEEKFEAILANQLPDVEKRAQADFIIETGRGVDYALKGVRHVLAEIVRRGLGQKHIR